MTAVTVIVTNGRGQGPIPMGGNPFHHKVDDVFIGERVRVHTETAVYEGWLQIREYNDRSAFLLDAERVDGDRVGEVVVNDIAAIERCEPDATIERVSVDSLVPSPYTQRSFETENFRQFVRQVRDRGHLPSFPLARPLDDGRFEIVSGHRRVEAARRAGLVSVPVRVADMTDREALTVFLDEHVPAGKDELDDATDPYSGWYRPTQLDALVERLRKDWDEQQLRDHTALAWYLEEASMVASSASDTPDGDGNTPEDDATGTPDSDSSVVDETAGSRP